MERPKFRTMKIVYTSNRGNRLPLITSTFPGQIMDGNRMFSCSLSQTWRASLQCKMNLHGPYQTNSLRETCPEKSDFLHGKVRRAMIGLTNSRNFRFVRCWVAE